MTNKPHYQHGLQKKIAVVFSCPGKEEESANCPASGKTGMNLETLLDMLYKNDVLDTKMTKSYLRITNAWDKVLYKKKINSDGREEGRTEANLSKSEIFSIDNLSRLKKELDDITDLIICFGLRADKAVKKLNLEKENLKIIRSDHLSLQSLNRNKKLKKDLTGSELRKGDKENTNKRLEVLANEIKTKISKT